MSPRAASIDEAEVERFERLGGEWWDPRGPMRALHKLNPSRVAWIRERIGVHFDRPGRDVRLDGLRVLDIGCGGGLLSESLARLGAEVTAIDPAGGNIAIAARHAASAGLAIDYRAVSAEELAASGARYDVVCAMEVIEHVVDFRAFARLVCSLARPGGLILFATLNRTLKSFGLAIIGAEYILGWAPKGTHQWEKFVTPDELEDAVENAGAHVADRTGLIYVPVLDVWRAGRDLGVNYMMACVRED